jgi:hypothetical protein
VVIQLVVDNTGCAHGPPNADARQRPVGDAFPPTTTSQGSDPTGTLSIRKELYRSLNQGWGRVKQAVTRTVGQEDAFGLGSSTPTVVASSVGQLEVFSSWFGNLEDRIFEGVHPALEKAVERGYYLGATQAKAQVGKPLQQALPGPGVVLTSAVQDLQGIASAALQQSSRFLSHALLQKHKPVLAARGVNTLVDSIGVSRSNLLASYAVVRAHAEGTLDAFEILGVQYVGTIPERIRGRATHDAVELSKIKLKIIQPPPKPRTVASRRVRARPGERRLVNIQTAEDDRVCPICISISEAGPYPISQARGLIPAHPRAVLEGTTIASYGAVHEMVRARFSGPAVHLRTGAKFLTIGPNHPMLTRRGFVAAGSLCKGDELLYDLRVDPSPTVRPSHPDFKQVPLVEDCFETLRLSSFCSGASASHHDLHGDAVFCQGEIEIVHPARQLLLVLDSCGIEKVCKLALARSDADLFLKAALRSVQQGFNCSLAAACRLMGGSHLVAALTAGHAGPFDHFLFGSGAAFDTSTFENAGDDMPAGAKALGNGQDTLAGLIQASDGVLRWERVLDIRHGWFSGWAFDASTATGIYNSNGFVVKNCRCRFMAVS